MNSFISVKPMASLRTRVPRVSTSVVNHPVSLVLLLALAFGARTDVLHGKVLQWNLMPGQRYQLTVERVIKQSSPVISWDETVRYQLLWVISQRNEDGTAEIVQTLVGVEHSLRFPGTPVISYDSSDDGEPRGDAAVLAKRWSGKIKSEQRLKLKPNGELAITDADRAAASANASPTALPAAVGAASWQPIPKLLQKAECILPTVDMPVDYNWSTSQSTPWGGDEATMNLTTVYVYRGTESVDEVPLDVVESNTRWELVAKPNMVTTLVIERQSGQGKIYFDATAGYIARADRSENLVVRILRPGVEPTQVAVDVTLKVRCEPLEPVNETRSPADEGQG